MFDIHATNAPAFVIAVDGGEFRLDDINAACVRASDMQLEAELGKRLQERFARPLAEKLEAYYRKCVETRLPLSYDIESILRAGYTHWRTVLIPFMSQDNGAVTSLVGFCTDITAETMADRAKNAFHDKLSLAIGALDGGFWVYDSATEEFETSRPLAELLAGPGQTSLTLAEYANYVHAEDLRNSPTVNPELASVDYRVITYAGRTRWLHSKRRFIRDEAGKLTRIVGLVIDVTEERARQQQLETEATTDALTGLRNRRSFDRVAARWLMSPYNADEAFALVLIDLDGFKPINDRYGHRAGDDILRAVARRLDRLARPDDALARIGGDEFAILVREGAQAAQVLAERLQRAFAQPFRCNDAMVRVGASFGIATQEKSDGAIEAMMDRADAVLYAAKSARPRLTA